MMYFSIAGAALVAGIWQGCVLVLAVALTLRLLPGVSARARSVIWLAVLLVVMALPFLPMRGSVGGGQGVQAGWEWTLALGAAWVMASAVRAGRLVWSAWLLRGIARRARVLDVAAEVGELLDGRVVVCVSDEVSVPSVAGFFAPRILLPAGMVFSGSDMRQIVVHEMEHLRRKDDWVNLLQKISLVVFPLNPALLWVEKRLCAERELACDDAVLRATGSAKAYASCLASLAEHTLVRRGVSLALGAWERRPELAKRVTRILARPQGEMRHSRAVVAMLLLGVAGGAAELSRAPQMVRFASGRETFVAQAPLVTPSSGRLVLASAVMPVAPRADGLVGDGVVVSPRPTTQRQDVRHTVLRRVVQRSNSTSVAKGWHPVLRRVVMEDEAAPRRVLLSFDEDSQTSYAAIPVRNGWLIFQL